MRITHTLAVLIMLAGAALPTYAQESEAEDVPKNPFAVAPTEPKPTLQELAVRSQMRADAATAEAEQTAEERRQSAKERRQIEQQVADGKAVLDALTENPD